MRNKTYLQIAFLISCIVICSMTTNRSMGAQRFKDITVSVKPIIQDARSAFGYMEYRVELINNSTTRKHHVELKLPARRYGNNGDSIESIIKRVTIEPKSRTEVSLLQPSIRLSYNSGMAIIIDNKEQNNVISMSSIEHPTRTDYYSSSSTDPNNSVLIGREVSVSLQKQIQDSTFKKCTSTLPVQEWSSNWLGYSRFSAIVVTDNEINTMHPGVRDAISKYCRCGGVVIIEGATEFPKGFQPAQGFVNNNIASLDFGICALSRSNIPTNPLNSMISQTSNSLARKDTPAKANNILSVIGKIEVPVTGMLVLITIFSVALGPFAIIFLSIKNKRIWLLWLVPSVSFLMCLIVFLYTSFSEGWGSHSRQQALTILNEDSGTATTLGWLGYYCPLTPGPLNFDSTTEVTAQVASDDGYYYRDAPGKARSIDLTNGQDFTSGWITARTPAHFKTRDSSRHRERLSVHRKDGIPLAVINGLGTTISELALADQSGKIYIARDIAAGQRPNSHLPPIPSRHSLTQHGDIFSNSGIPRKNPLQQLYYPLVPIWPNSPVQVRSLQHH